MLSRRKFLVGSAVAGAIGKTERARALIGILGGSPASGGVAPGALPTLTLTPSVTSGAGVSVPWTFGHAFKQGDVPSGQYLTGTNTSAFQADVRNYWPDGSAKYAVLSGISPFASGTTIAVQLGRTSTAPSGTNVAEPTSLPTVSAVLTTTGTPFSISAGGSYAIDSVLGVDLSTWPSGGTSGGLVRRVLGPVMSEFHYFQPTSDAHLSLWWFVRVYSNGQAAVKCVVENGWFLKASPSQKDYGISLYVSNSTTPDFSTASTSYIGQVFESQFGKSWYSSPATGELLLADPTPTVIPGVNCQIALNGSYAALYTVASQSHNAPAWNSTTAYVVGNFVLFNSTQYQCAQANTGQSPTAGASNAYWTEITETAGGAECTYMTTTGGTLPSSVTNAFLVGHLSHTRWSYVGWVGATQFATTPAHDPAYLRNTLLVPNYGYTSPDSATLDGYTLTVNPTPFALGNFDAAMASTGYHQYIGILPAWESLYCTTADAHTYNATTGNNQCAGRWPIFYRDETTGRPINYLNYPSYTLTSSWGTQPPVASGASQTWDIPHHFSNGYLPYMIDGWWDQLESLLFTASDVIMESNPPTRQSGGVLSGQNSPLTTRGVAWAWRTMAQAAAIAPRYVGGASLPIADSTIISAYVQSIHDTAQWHNSTYVPTSMGGAATGSWANTIGYLGQYDNEAGINNSTTGWWGSHWMVCFQSMALRHAVELSIEGLTNGSELLTVSNFSLQNSLAIMGSGSSPAWNFRSAGLYARPYFQYGSTPNSASPVFWSISQAYTAYLTQYSLSSSETANSGDPILQPASQTNENASTSDMATGYWMQQVGVLAQAVDAGASGALAAYDLALAASNWAPAQSGQTGQYNANDAPQFAFVPRTV